MCGDGCYGPGTVTDDLGLHNLARVIPGLLGFSAYYETESIRYGPLPLQQYDWTIGCSADLSKIAFYIIFYGFPEGFVGPFDGTITDCDPLTASVTLPSGGRWDGIVSSGTVSLPLLPPPFPDDQCCFPCPIPKSDLNITVGAGAPSTLPFTGTHFGISQWSDGTHSLTCSGNLPTLTAPGGPYLLGSNAINTLCDTFHLEFESDGESGGTGPVIHIDP